MLPKVSPAHVMLRVHEDVSSSAVRSLCLSVSLSPGLHALVDFIPCDTIFYELHCHPQHLDVLVPALVVEEEHILEFDPAVSVYSLEVCRLAARVYLEVIEVVDG